MSPPLSGMKNNKQSKKQAASNILAAYFTSLYHITSQKTEFFKYILKDSDDGV
jgi:hypothetical protein